MSADRAHRLWRLYGFKCRENGRGDEWHTVARARFRQRAANQVWAYGFVHDACANGQQFKCLTIIDEVTRECLAIDVAGSIRSAESSKFSRTGEYPWRTEVPAIG